MFHGRSYAVAMVSWVSFCSSPSMKVIGPPIAIAWASWRAFTSA
jgi:hypothetical protein